MSTPGELLEALGREARARFGNGGEGGTRTYRGRSVEELVPQIQRELGADAIIVRRREGLTGGVLGFFQHPYVEIEAMHGTPGVDVYDEAEDQMPPAPVAEPAAPQAAPAPAAAYPQAPPSYAPPPQSYSPPAPSYAPSAPAYAPPAPAPSAASTASQPAAVPPAPPPSQPAPFYTQPAVAPPPASPLSAAPVQAGSAYVTAHLAALARAGRAQPRVPPSVATPERREETRAWAAELAELRRSSELAEMFPAPTARPPAPAPQAPQPAPPTERRVVGPGSQGRARAGVARSLQRTGIGEELARELIEGASAHALALAPRAGLAQAVRQTLAQRIPVAPPLSVKGAAIVLVGAGGAGKTTCCAALLGAYRRSSSLPASCATITREGEPEELRMVLSPTIMKPLGARSPRATRALRKAREDGLAVVDTPSVSPSDRAGVRELARLLAELQAERVVVALPATLGAAAAAQLLQALKPLGANSLAITHADETDQIGVAVEAACRFALAPEYVLDRVRTGGWRLRSVGPAALAERVLP